MWRGVGALGGNGLRQGSQMVLEEGGWRLRFLFDRIRLCQPMARRSIEANPTLPLLVLGKSAISLSSYEKTRPLQDIPEVGSRPSPLSFLAILVTHYIRVYAPLS